MHTVPYEAGGFQTLLNNALKAQNYKWQNGKDCNGKTIYEQSALAQRVRQNFLAEGRFTSSPPPPHTLWRTHRPPQ